MIGAAICAGGIALSIALLAHGARYGLTIPASTDASTTTAARSPDARLACCDRPPVLAGQTYGEPVAVDIDGDRVAVVYGGRIVVVDVAVPASPRVLGYGPKLAALPFDIDLAGGFAYLAGGAAGVDVVDVRDPGAIRAVGHIATAGSANAIVVDGSRAYVADGPAGLAIVDVADPTAMRELGRIDTPGDAVSVAVKRETAYVADFEAGLQIVDVGDPVVPWLVASLAPPHASLRAWDVALLGERALVTTDDGQLWSVHVDLRSAPRSMDVVQVFGGRFPGISFGVIAVGDKIVMIGTGLYVLDSIRVNLKELTITRPVPGAATSGGLVAALDEAGMLRLFDASKPRTLVELSAYPLAAEVDRAAIGERGRAFTAGGRAYAKPGGVHAIDVADPDRPRPRGWLPFANPGNSDTDRVHDVAVVGGHALVASGPMEYRSLDPHLLSVYDVADPDHPRAMTSLRLSETPREIVVAGDVAYVAMGSNREVDSPHTFRGGVRIFDLSALPALREIGLWIDDDRIDHLALAGDRLYLAGRRHKDVGGFPYRSVIHVMDVSKPSAPRRLGTRETILANYAIELTAIVAAGSTAFVATAPGGRTSSSVLEAFDVADPTNVRSLGTLTIRGTVRAAVLNTPHLLAATAVYSESQRGAPLDQQGGVAAGDHSRLDVIDIGRPEAMAIRSQAFVPVRGVQAADLALDRSHAYMATGPHGLWVFDVGSGGIATPSPSPLSTAVPSDTPTPTDVPTSMPTPTDAPTAIPPTATATIAASPTSVPPRRWRAHLPYVERATDAVAAP